jgi:hypothetical protein
MESGGLDAEAVEALHASSAGRGSAPKAPGAVGRRSESRGAFLDLITQLRRRPARTDSAKRLSVTPNEHFSRWRRSMPASRDGSRGAPFEKRGDGT